MYCNVFITSLLLKLIQLDVCALRVGLGAVKRALHPPHRRIPLLRSTGSERDVRHARWLPETYRNPLVCRILFEDRPNFKGDLFYNVAS